MRQTTSATAATRQLFTPPVPTGRKLLLKVPSTETYGIRVLGTEGLIINNVFAADTTGFILSPGESVVLDFSSAFIVGTATDAQAVNFDVSILP